MIDRFGVLHIGGLAWLKRSLGFTYVAVFCKYLNMRALQCFCYGYTPLVRWCELPLVLTFEMNDPVFCKKNHGHR